MDLGLSRDMFDSFVKYQSLMMGQFQKLQKSYGFRIIDGNQSVDGIQQELRADIEEVMKGH